MPDFRCPVDDKVFNTQDKKGPGRDGHPDCDGPACKKKFAEPAALAGNKPISPAVNWGSGGLE
jgi:hypothetical protein